jgi:L-lactate dehydrogenase (cytochrome)
LSWKDISWLKSITSLPIILKGIQCGEDAVLAARAGCKAIIVSNHGGRQLDFARSAVEVLPEVMDALRAIHADKHMEVYVDGGIRRGTDIFKCLALGARAVGIGRPVLYGMAGYGEAGSTRVIEMLRDELVMTMRLMGTPTVQDIRSDMVITRNLADHAALVPDSLSNSVYQPLVPQSAFARL